MKLFRDKPIELHCYTARSNVYNRAPVKQGSEIARPWFRALPSNKKSKGSDLNASSCPAIRQELKGGVVLPLWSDLRIRVGPNGEENWWKYQYADGESTLSQHFLGQLGMPEEEEQNLCLKLMSPWAFKCSHDIPFLFTGDQLELLKYGGIEVIQGKIDFKHQAGVNINLLVRKKETEIDIVLPYLLPMLKLIPLTEKKIAVVNHLVTQEVFSKLLEANRRNSFSNSYYKCKAAMGKKGSFKFKAEE